MKRRTLLQSAGSTVAALSAQVTSPKSSFVDLLYVHMRNSAENQLQRTTDFLRSAYLPAVQRAGGGPVGFFSALIGPGSPFVLAVTGYPSMAAMETAGEKLAADAAYQKAVAAFHGLPGLSYVRLERQLLRGFDGMPRIEPPPIEPNRPPRIFELRTYESNNPSTLRRKIGMFNNGEIAIFRRVGILPVFFGDMIFGANMPNLTYLVAYDDWAARDKVWRAFLADPEWKKLSAEPGLSNAEIVSSISNVLLRPLPFSQIR